jgi:hypothetical protein
MVMRAVLPDRMVSARIDGLVNLAKTIPAIHAQIKVRFIVSNFQVFPHTEEYTPIEQDGLSCIVDLGNLANSITIMHGYSKIYK